MFAPLSLTQVRGPECASYPSHDGVGLSNPYPDKHCFGPNQAAALSKTAALSSGVPVEVGTCPPRGGQRADHEKPLPLARSLAAQGFCPDHVTAWLPRGGEHVLPFCPTTWRSKADSRS